MALSPEALLKHQADQAFVNLALVLGLYSLVYFVFNGFEPTKRFFKRWRFNQGTYPGRLIVDLEILRTARSVIICSALDASIMYMRARYGWFPLISGDDWTPRALSEEFKADPTTFLSRTAAILLWADFHFYFTHRLLHTSYLFKHVHSVHHESKNPDAFSGLSFHYAEALLYFTSLLGCLFIPMSLAMFTAFRWGLLISPVGHNSAGPRPHGQYYPALWEDHWLHHVIVTKNFASGLLPFGGIWDNLLGTRYIPEKYRKEKAT
jgi:sterol desaturase/sphingolipid hydroxylase (fatty acid hydroxylase superfamily)